MKYKYIKIVLLYKKVTGREKRNKPNKTTQRTQTQPTNQVRALRVTVGAEHAQ